MLNIATLKLSMPFPSWDCTLLKMKFVLSNSDVNEGFTENDKMSNSRDDIISVGEKK